MPGSLTLVTKGKLFNRIDAALARPTQAMRDALAAVSDPADIFSVGLERDVVDDDQPSRDHLLRDLPLFWPDAANTLEILRAGYLHALDVSLSHPTPKPIVSFWIRGFDLAAEYADDQTSHEFIVSDREGGKEVQLFWISPNLAIPDPPPAPERSFLERIWSVSSEARLNEIRDSKFPAGYVKATPTDVDGTTDVKFLQLTGY